MTEEGDNGGKGAAALEGEIVLQVWGVKMEVCAEVLRKVMRERWREGERRR